MARSRLNLLRYYAKIVEITNAHYIEGFTYSYVWRKYVYPVYPISYDTYMRIINYPRLAQELEDLEAARANGALRPRVSEVRKPELWELPSSRRVPQNQLPINFPDRE